MNKGDHEKVTSMMQNSILLDDDMEGESMLIGQRDGYTDSQIIEEFHSDKTEYIFTRKQLYASFKNVLIDVVKRSSPITVGELVKKLLGSETSGRCSNFDKDTKFKLGVDYEIIDHDCNLRYTVGAYETGLKVEISPSTESMVT